MGLAANPVRWCEPLGEEEPDEREPLDPIEVMAVSRAMAAGQHRAERRVAVGPRVKGRKTVAREPNADELAELRRQDEQDAVAVLVLAFCGIRLGELAALRWRHIDFSGGQIRIERSFSPANGSEGPTKGKERRWTVLPDQVSQPLAKLGTRSHFTKDEDLVICNATGDHIDVSAFRRRFKRAVKAAGVDRHVRLHDLRHGATTDLRSVFTADHVQKLVGHRDARTAQRYAHARDQSDAAARWSAYLAEQIEEAS
jgi:integrase